MHCLASPDDCEDAEKICKDDEEVCSRAEGADKKHTIPASDSALHIHAMV